MGHYASKQKRTCDCCKGSMELRIDKDNSFRNILEHISHWKSEFEITVNLNYLRGLKNNGWSDCPVCNGLGHETIIVDEWRD